VVARRVLDEPGYVLHRYDWSESSLILDVFTRRHGRVALVAKGAKRPSSSLRPVLLPLQALRMAFGGDGEIRTLRAAEWGGGHVMPTGDALLAGYYLNELLQRLLAREDAHPRLFDTYAQAVELLASEHGEALQPVLRSFELLLLRETGVLPALDAQTATLEPLDAAVQYTLVPEGGLRERHADDRAGLSGAQWMALHEALLDPAPYMATLHAGALLAPALKPQLRALLHYHCGGKPLHTRQLMMDLQSL
jgi:DNA repair protein RecO (recombination protein O)